MLYRYSWTGLIRCNWAEGSRDGCWHDRFSVCYWSGWYDITTIISILSIHGLINIYHGATLPGEKNVHTSSYDFESFCIKIWSVHVRLWCNKITTVYLFSFQTCNGQSRSPNLLYLWRGPREERFPSRSMVWQGPVLGLSGMSPDGEKASERQEKGNGA